MRLAGTAGDDAKVKQKTVLVVNPEAYVVHWQCSPTADEYVLKVKTVMGGQGTTFGDRVALVPKYDEPTGERRLGGFADEEGVEITYKVVVTARNCDWEVDVSAER